MTRLVIAVLALICVLAHRPILQAQTQSLTEKQKIEALIKHVEVMKDVKFIRNDREADAKTAARFLRGKWEAKEAEIKTAKEFIEKVASISSTTGKPYLIRFKDGKQMKGGDYLMGELKKLDNASMKTRKP
jgi:hypothetical protein